MTWHVQLSRYTLVGLASNAVGYILYLLLTYVGMGHKTAMTLLYGIGVLQTFYFNRSWSFRHAGRLSGSFARYVALYAVGYLFNLLMLLLMVDQLGLPHQWVQAALIFVLAGMFFVMQRYWVFAAPNVSPLGR